MTGRREILRQRAKSRRDVARAVAQQQKDARLSHVSKILNHIREMTADPAFVEVALAQGIDTVPCSIASTEIPRSDSNDILVFIVAWKFVTPMFNDAELSQLIETKWPGFIAEMKDVFISLVTDGPFPDERKPALRSIFFR